MLICIVGKTCSGKDTIAKYISEQLKIDIICSYTTRPKRKTEVNGREHIFVSKEEFDEIMSKGNVLAYTKFPETGYEYCASGDIENKDWIYIINPEGIETLNAENKIVIYIDCPEEIIKERSEKRGDPDLIKRLNGEREQFDNFKNSKKYDYLIENNFTNIDDLKEYITNSEVYETIKKKMQR